jgi:hypothetical protein
MIGESPRMGDSLTYLRGRELIEGTWLLCSDRVGDPKEVAT